MPPYMAFPLYRGFIAGADASLPIRSMAIYSRT
jgi:hypothetical protein